MGIETFGEGEKEYNEKNQDCKTILFNTDTKLFFGFFSEIISCHFNQEQSINTRQWKAN